MNALYELQSHPFKKRLTHISEQTPRLFESGRVYMIETERLSPNPLQPRFVFKDEPILRLADSIRQFGILQPLSVRISLGEVHNNMQSYEIIAGERRWRAAKIIGLDEVPCIILDVDSKKSAELAIIENIQREDLNVFEQASAIAALIDIYGLTQEQAARQLSSSQSYVANKLRLLKLTPIERNMIISSGLSERHARALLRISDVSIRTKAIEHIAAKELNVSATERYIDCLLCERETYTSNNMQTKVYLKDLRFFFNSVDRAVSILKNCGIDVITERKEAQNETAILIRIPH